MMFIMGPFLCHCILTNYLTQNIAFQHLSAALLANAIKKLIRSQQEAVSDHGGAAVEEATIAKVVCRELFELRLCGQNEGLAVAGQVVEPAVGEEG